MSDNGKRFDLLIKVLSIMTPILVTINLFLVGMINTKIDKVDNKLFTHLTNHELHVPRNNIVSKAIFENHKKFLEDKINNLKNYIEKLEK